MYSIETKSLSKHFGAVKAIDDVSFTVDDGEVFGFLGPNGAGKSTTMMILTTLLKPTMGQAIVSGYDVATQAKKVRSMIGYVPQETTVDEYLTGRENLILQARLNHISKEKQDKRIDEILDLIELTEKQNDAVVTYSGGMRKRLDIAGGLLHRPKVLFLDEPTVGLDIQTRRKIWSYIKTIYKEFGMSIFLSTHYMEEADNLCNKVGIIDYGKIQVIDTPESMKNAMGQEVISLTLDSNHADNLISEIKQIDFVKDINFEKEQLIIFTSNGTEVIPQIFSLSSKLGTKINTISLTKPTLDDVFISYTGHDLRDDYDGFNRKREHRKMKRISS